MAKKTSANIESRGITRRKLGRPEGGSGEETRDRLIQAAAALFAMKGTGITLADIAGAAGLTGPAIYNYFSSKDELFIEITCRMFDEIAEAMSEAADNGSMYWLDRLDRILETSRLLYRDDAVLQRLGRIAQVEWLINPDRFQVISEARRRVESCFQRVMRDAIRDGDFPADLDAQIAGTVLASLVLSGLGSYSLFQPSRRDYDAAVEMFKQFVIRDRPRHGE